MAVQRKSKQGQHNAAGRGGACRMQVRVAGQRQQQAAAAATPFNASASCTASSLHAPTRSHTVCLSGRQGGCKSRAAKSQSAPQRHLQRELFALAQQSCGQDQQRNDFDLACGKSKQVRESAHRRGAPTASVQCGTRRCGTAAAPGRRAGSRAVQAQPTLRTQYSGGHSRHLFNHQVVHLRMRGGSASRW